MIDYAKFLSKRILRRKSNIVLFLLSFVVVFIFLMMNMNAQGEFRDKIEQQIYTDKETMRETQTKLSEYEENSEEVQLYKKEIQFLESNIASHEEILVYIDQKDWPSVYAIYSEVLENQLHVTQENEEASNVNKELSDYEKQQLMYITYLKDHDLAYENPDFPIYGLSFVVHLSKTILPIFMVVCCIYVFVQLFTLDYHKGLDIGTLYPIRKRKVVLTKILLGAGFSIFIFLFILFIAFLLSFFMTGENGFQYPIFMQNGKSETWYAISTLALFEDSILLGCLFFIGLSIFIYLLSNIIHEDMYLLLVSLCIVLGFAFLPTIVGELKLVMQYLPTTYYDFVKVTDGSLARQNLNPHITKTMGITVLSIFISLQMLLCFLETYIEKVWMKKS